MCLLIVIWNTCYYSVIKYIPWKWPYKDNGWYVNSFTSRSIANYISCLSYKLAKLDMEGWIRYSSHCLVLSVPFSNRSWYYALLIADYNNAHFQHVLYNNKPTIDHQHQRLLTQNSTQNNSWNANVVWEWVIQ